ncbi:hypothetical protein WR25_16460 [Diploscapter pachys]|uniref:Uncharacterized protein n=1 Tax=Diploscapter pachys TaxID=2018661 RepID=A0A2A2M3N3_9BILA|nr:hypothetical protein WR25_16460 [Diploscapter pachys]
MHERVELGSVEMTVRPHAGAQVEPIWPHLADRLAHVASGQAAGQKDRTRARADELGADRPVMRPARAAQFGNRRIRPAGIEKECVDIRRIQGDHVERLAPLDVDHLYPTDVGKPLRKLTGLRGIDVRYDLHRRRLRS